MNYDGPCLVLQQSVKESTSSGTTDLQDARPEGHDFGRRACRMKSKQLESECCMCPEEWRGLTLHGMRWEEFWTARSVLLQSSSPQASAQMFLHCDVRPQIVRKGSFVDGKQEISQARSGSAANLGGCSMSMMSFLEHLENPSWPLLDTSWNRLSRVCAVSDHCMVRMSGSQARRSRSSHPEHERLAPKRDRNPHHRNEAS